MQAIGTESMPARRRSAKWFWLAIALIWAGLFCNQWYVRENSRAKSDLDKIQAALNRQSDDLKAQNIEVSKENGTTLVLIKQQKKMLGQPGYSQTEFDRLNDQIQAAQAQVDARLLDEKPASDQYADAVQRYTAASAQYIRLVQSRTHQSILWTFILIGGAMIALLMAIIGQGRLWQRQIQLA